MSHILFARRSQIWLPLMISVVAYLSWGISWGAGQSSPIPKSDFTDHARPALVKYCISCHSSKDPKGDLDLESLTSDDAVVKAVKSLPTIVDAVGTHVMPPKKSPQPTEAERQKLVEYFRGVMAVEAKKHAGDPGRVIVRRLSNAEYDYTIRDLTGIDLKPTRDFPVDGAAGEGFTNAGDALVMSPTLLNKYLGAAKEISSHAVLLPDGFRFSSATTKRDRTNEAVAALKGFYASFTPDGKLPLKQYLSALVRSRDELLAGKTTLAALAAKEKLNTKYLAMLWETLTGKTAGFPLDRIRNRFRTCTPSQIEGLLAEINAWQTVAWRFVPIGSYRDNNTARQIPAVTLEPQPKPLRLTLKPTAGQNEVVLYLTAQELTPHEKPSKIVYRSPRLERKGQPTLLLKDHSLDTKRFDGADIPATAGEVIAIKLRADLARDREVVVEPSVGQVPDAIFQFQLRSSPPPADHPIDPGLPLVGNPSGKHLTQLDDFRRCFPTFICYQRVIPDDEVVCLKLYHREDAELIRLFLSTEQSRQLDRLWADLIYLSEQPITESDYLPQFVGYVSQDGGPKALAFYKALQEPFRKQAEDYRQTMARAIPGQLESLLGFAARAYRRPLAEKEQIELRGLYKTLRQKGLSHDEAFRTTLTRILVSPSFLFKIERSQPVAGPSPVSDWELATRLSYFLWASAPDDELRQLAAAGQLGQPAVLEKQVARMLADPRVRGLATEFGTQWLHVRDFRGNKEKNEKLFPTFTEPLRDALFEESVLFFTDLFQADRPVGDVLDSDHTYLNELLAKHYGIPGVAGPEWRRVGGMKKVGRGGVLGLGSVLAAQSGASRTSPILRGNWVIEVLLGEKLPRPPANVPRLPEDEAAADGTVREIVEKHTRVAECAACHRRIDPIGFSLEKFDPIGRLRDKDLGGRAVDAHARMVDGSTFSGLDGLRDYLLTKRRADFEHHFSQKLLGYALGRSVILSDSPLLDEMTTAASKTGHISAAVRAIVLSKQFRYHRGLEVE